MYQVSETFFSFCWRHNGWAKIETFVNNHIWFCHSIFFLIDRHNTAQSSLAIPSKQPINKLFIVITLYHKNKNNNFILISITFSLPFQDPIYQRRNQMWKNMRSISHFVIFLLIFIVKYGELCSYVVMIIMYLLLSNHFFLFFFSLNPNHNLFMIKIPLTKNIGQ